MFTALSTRFRFDLWSNLPIRDLYRLILIRHSVVSAVASALAVVMVLQASAAIAQDIPIDHPPITASQSRQMMRMDEYILSEDGAQFRNSYDNKDRIHVRITLSRGSGTLIGITTPVARSEAQNAQLLQRFAGALKWRLTRLQAGTWHNSNITSAYLNANAVLKGDTYQARIDLGAVLNVLRQEGINKVEVRIRAYASPTLRLIPHDLRWVRASYGGRPVFAGVFQTDEMVSPILAQYGFTSSDRVRGWINLVAVLVIPM